MELMGLAFSRQFNGHDYELAGKVAHQDAFSVKTPKNSKKRHLYVLRIAIRKNFFNLSLGAPTPMF